jgi:1-acyl-sn-glycerol-3-phosphate acyltransferase
MQMVFLERRWDKDRENMRRHFATLTRLNAPTWLVLFPEGTRIPRGQKGEYKSGGARLAIAAGVPVIPIAVTSARCWPTKAFVKTPGVVDISIGRAISSEGRSADELMREVETWIESEMHRLDPEAYPALAGN